MHHQPHTHTHTIYKAHIYASSSVLQYYFQLWKIPKQVSRLVNKISNQAKKKKKNGKWIKWHRLRICIAGYRKLLLFCNANMQWKCHVFNTVCSNNCRQTIQIKWWLPLAFAPFKCFLNKSNKTREPVHNPGYINRFNVNGTVGFKVGGVQSRNNTSI